MTASLRASLKLLKTDFIEINFIYGFDLNTPLEKALKVFQNFVSHWKILCIGVSPFAALASSHPSVTITIIGTENSAKFPPFLKSVDIKIDYEIKIEIDK